MNYCSLSLYIFAKRGATLQILNNNVQRASSARKIKTKSLNSCIISNILLFRFQVKKEVVWFHITMNNVILMNFMQSREELSHVLLDVLNRHDV